MAIKVETTTDSVDDVKRSVGDDVVVEGENADEGGDGAEAGADKDKAAAGKKPKGEEEPAGAKKKPAGAPAKDAADDDNAEDNEESEDDDDKDEPDGDKAKGKSSEEPHKKNRPNRYRRRIDKLERELDQERTKREDLERKVAAPKSGAADDDGDPKKPVSYTGKPKPKRADFAASEDPDADLYEALGRWGAAEEVAKSEFERNSKAARTESQQVLKAYTERVADAKTLIPEFDQAFEDLDDDLPVTPDMQYVIFTSEIGPFISHYLATHVERAAQIAEMEGPDAIRAMGRIEAIVQAEVDKLREAAKAEGDDKGSKSSKESKAKEQKTLNPPKKTVSQAPPPPNPLKGANAAPKTLKDIAGTEDRLVDHVKFNSDYERMRKEQRRGST